MIEDTPRIPWTHAGPSIITEMWAGDGEIDPTEATVPDMLSTLFARQRELMLAVWGKEITSGLSIATSPDDWGDLDLRTVQGRIHETFGHLIRELAEAMAHLDGSKSWKDKPRPVDRKSFDQEVVDSLHFFIELCILGGIDAESLFQGYFAKSAVNFDRKKKGY